MALKFSVYEAEGNTKTGTKSDRRLINSKSTTPNAHISALFSADFPFPAQVIYRSLLPGAFYSVMYADNNRL
jgi:hypothetical protein